MLRLGDFSSCRPRRRRPRRGEPAEGRGEGIILPRGGDFARPKAEDGGAAAPAKRLLNPWVRHKWLRLPKGTHINGCACAY